MSPRASAPSFYASALEEAEREDLVEAADLEGLDGEIALLRVRLRTAIEQHPDDFRLIESGARLLIQSLLAQHRLSPRQADNLGDAMSNLVEEFGNVMRSAVDE